MNTEELERFEQRKQDHIDLALQQKNQCVSSDIQKIILMHEALPDLNFSEVDISTQSLDKTWNSPFFISSMTAGHKNSININQVLAIAAAEMNWAMGVGSQRRELEDTNAQTEWKTIRKNTPNIKLYGNLGIAQIIEHKSSVIARLCEQLQAEALFIHCNALQEIIQPEGTPNFSGCLQAIKRLINDLPIPVIIKETGCGFSESTLKRLIDCQPAAVDVSGLGGTHWGRIEGNRTHLETQKAAAESFKNWGISTLQSLLHAKALQPNYEYWASGGVRTGLDAAKFLALGAKRVGIAKPMLEAALQGTEAVIQLMKIFEFELKTALFCTGSRNLKQLQEPQKWRIQN